MMWAQIVKSRMKPGVEADMASMGDEMRARIARRPGLVRSFWMQNQNDPHEYYSLIVFETEEQAREGERGLEQDELFQRMNAMTEGTPEFVDLNVIDEIS